MGRKGKAKAPQAETPDPPEDDRPWMAGLDKADRALAQSCLSEQEFKDRKEKMVKAQAKAEANQRQQIRANERWEQYQKDQEKQNRKQAQEEKKQEKQFEKEIQRAKQEGVVEAIWGDDDLWWAKLPSGDWREVQGEYYCTMCEKHLNGSSLSSHLNSDKHQKWVAHTQGSAAPNSTAAPPKAPAASSSSRCPPCGYPQQNIRVEDWMEAVGDGSFKCLACNKVMTDEHASTDVHKNRVENWRQYQQLQTTGYQAPPEEHLAWVPSVESDPTSERWMKCLLCEKWCQDDTSHSGRVGVLNPPGSKEHLKNLRNYEWYKDKVQLERIKWHPETAASTAAPTRSTAKAAAAKATPAPWAASTTAKAAPPPKAAPKPLAEQPLPQGWEEHKDDECNSYFYYPATGKTQWDRPTKDTPTAIGWTTAQDENGDRYYYNEETGVTQWEPPDNA